VTEQIYERPRDYDLEHETDCEDLGFYTQLLSDWRPRRVLELACGSARVTLPLAELGARTSFDIVGVELAQPMLEEAERKRAAAPPDVQSRVTFVRGDMRFWRDDKGRFDVILTPGSSMRHVLTLEDQLAVWRAAWDNLLPGGRFVVDVASPDLPACASAAQVPARKVLDLDTDSTDPVSGERLIRYKAVTYLPHQQRAQTTFLYDKFDRHHRVDRYVSDFEAHVYFPRELQLLFLHTGFEIEAIFGDWRRAPLRRTSSQMIAIGRKGEGRQ